MNFIENSVNRGIFVSVCEANICEVSQISHVLWAKVTWQGGNSCGQSPLFSEALWNPGRWKAVHKYKILELVSRIIAKNLLLFLFAGMCAAVLI